jgi:hypothetical protein
MIHIDPKAEPANFDTLVRQPGHRFLGRTPNPTTRQWNTHAYWRKMLAVLHDLYGGVCAYSCHWIPYDTGADTVEHFQPKDRYPQQAYEWANYRLVCATLNGRKGTNEDVLDPFHIQNGWFVIDFPSLQIKPAPGLDPGLTESIQKTIDRLRLNNEGTCLKSREAYIKDYCLGCITFTYLRRKAPFLGLELERQNLVTVIKEMMIYDVEPCV